MGNTKAKEMSPLKQSYCVRFVVRMPSTEPLAYLQQFGTWIHCIESVMRFATDLELGEYTARHVPIYNLNVTFAVREADIYRVTVSWTSSVCLEKSMKTTLHIFIEKELRKVIHTLYGVKSTIVIRKIEQSPERALATRPPP